VTSPYFGADPRACLRLLPTPVVLSLRSGGYTLRMLLAALLAVLVAMSGVVAATARTALRMMTVIGVFVPGRRALRAILRQTHEHQPRHAGSAQHASIV
jgi:hypothetical protein